MTSNQMPTNLEQSRALNQGNNTRMKVISKSIIWKQLLLL